MITIRPAHFALLLLGTVTIGCASTTSAPLLVVKDAAPGEPLSGQHFQVERDGPAKKVRFRNLDTSRTTVMRYRGNTTTWDSPVNLFFDEDVYDKEHRRVRFRFRHPFTAEPMALVARARSRSVIDVKVRSRNDLPVLLLFAGDEKQPRGSLRYDDHSPILLAGQIEERRIEIERVAPDVPFDVNRGVLKVLEFGFPDTGDFVVRIDGRDAAWFTQWIGQPGVFPYRLDLHEELDEAAREDAMLAFVAFDLMKEFVNGSD